jgi:hypothetical protein
MNLLVLLLSGISVFQCILVEFILFLIITCYIMPYFSEYVKSKYYYVKYLYSYVKCPV